MGAGVAVVVVALLLTHYWSLWLVAALAAFLVLVAVRQPGRRGAAGRLLVAVAVGCLAFLPWLPVFVDQVLHTGTPWGRTRNPLAVLGMALNGFGGNLDVDGGARIFQGQLLRAAFVVLVVLAVLGRRQAEVGNLRRAGPRSPCRSSLAGLGLLTLGWVPRLPGERLGLRGRGTPPGS